MATLYINFLGSRPALARSTLHGRGPPCHWRGPPCTGAVHPATGALYPARARSTLPLPRSTLHGRAPLCTGALHPAQAHSTLHVIVTLTCTGALHRTWGAPGNPRFAQVAPWRTSWRTAGARRPHSGLHGRTPAHLLAHCGRTAAPWAHSGALLLAREHSWSFLVHPCQAAC